VPSPTLDERYGRTRATSRTRRAIAIAVAGAFALVLGAWVVWAALDGESASIEFRDVGHEIIDDRAVSVTWQVTADPGSDVTCVVKAMNEGFSDVGWKVVDLPASDERTRVFTEQVRTTELAVTGLIYRCWLA
jgi:hypothetical protein